MYNVRGAVGERKGKFIKMRDKLNIEKFNQRVAGKQGRPAARPTPAETPPQDDSTTRALQFPQHFGGRRFIEMEKLFYDMWCNNCDKPIAIRTLQHESFSGIVSKWHIRCTFCASIIVVETSKRSNQNYFDTNLKLANAMLDSGMGETKVNTLFSGMNSPTVNPKSLKRYERKVGPVIESVANRSCINAIEKEKMLTIAFNNSGKEARTDVNNNCDTDDTELGGSYDAAWPKRGKQHNSQSGHASLIGQFGGEVIAYACRNTACKQCRVNKDKPHDCRRNHNGSARAMEAAMAVDVILKNDNLVKAKCRVVVLIGDDDSAAIAALQKLSPWTIKKLSDFNHVAKTFNSKLYDMKLNATLIEYFRKMFALAIKQNKGNPEGVKLALENVVPHAFGEHDNCGQYCTKNEAGVHVHKYFKDGKCLTDEKLRHKLEAAIRPFINNAAKIADCASSQTNESFNNTICSKHPKPSFYGGTESHCYRVAVAVCQKNVGYTFIMSVNEELNLSPGKFTESFRKRKQEIFEEQKEKKMTIPAKKRRLELKKLRSSKQSAATSREGISYQSGSGYLNTSDLVDEVVIADSADFERCTMVIYDIETTGLHPTNDQIVQIAASAGSRTFEVYIMPPRARMNEDASAVTGIEIINQTMFVNNEEVVTCAPREGFMKFLYFLKSLGKPCILLAHNNFKFDGNRMIYLAKNLNLLTEFKLFVRGFCDSMDVFKSLLPKRREDKLLFNLGDLANDYLEKEDILPAHNALNDVLILKKLIEKLCTNESFILKKSRSFDYYENYKEINAKIKESLADLGISKAMMDKLCKAGIDKTVLAKACETGGYASLSILLGENVGGKPRVTSSKKIIQTIYNNFLKKNT